MNARSLLSILLAGSLTACNTTPVTLKNGTPVPASQLANPQLMQPSSTRTARVIVARDSGFVGSAKELTLSVNREAVVRLNAGQTVTFYLAPGKYIFAIQQTNSVFEADSNEVEVEVYDSALPPNNFRLQVVPGGNTKFSRSMLIE